MQPQDEYFRSKNRQRLLFKESLDELIDVSRPLAILGQKINWRRFEAKFGDKFTPGYGRPPVPTRVVVGLLYLKHTYNLSDDETLKRWEENPYWQHFCGYSYFEREAPCHPSVLCRWRKRMGEEAMEELLAETCAVALEAKYLKPRELDDVIVDTTVQEKNIAFPTDARLLNRAREHLVKEAKARGVELRQSYAREGKYQLVRYQRYSHAKQFRRAKKPLRRLGTILGRIIRELDRKIPDPDAKLAAKIRLARRILLQKKTDKNKVYSFHEPDVECISKGKAHKRYEFGCKVSFLSTNRSNWIVGAKTIHGRPYDGHTLAPQLEQAKRLIGRYPTNVYSDKGYRGVECPDGVRLYISGQKRGMTPKRHRLLRRRSAIEPLIGHMKSGHRLGRNFLKGLDGDKINPILAAAGRNMAKLLVAIFCQFYGRCLGPSNAAKSPFGTPDGLLQGRLNICLFFDLGGDFNDTAVCYLLRRWFLHLTLDIITSHPNQKAGVLNRAAVQAVYSPSAAPGNAIV